MQYIKYNSFIIYNIQIYYIMISSLVDMKQLQNTQNLIQLCPIKPPSRKPKFSSEVIQQPDAQTQFNFNLTEQQNQAYEQIASAWKHQQRQSIQFKLDKQGNTTIYKYDPYTPDFSVYEQPVQSQRDQIFGRYGQVIRIYLNAKYIIQEIVQPILRSRALDMQLLFNVEFMYLLTFRAWCEITTAITHFNQKKVKTMIPTFIKNKKKQKRMPEKIQFQFSRQDINLKYLVQPMVKLSLKCDTIFSQYHKILTLKQKYFSNRIKAIFQFIFQHAAKKTHDKYLCGFQGIDFTRNQQINYLHNHYIKAIIDILNKRQQSSLTILTQKLYILKKLLQIEIDKMQGFDDFQKVKNKLLQRLKNKKDNNLLSTYKEYDKEIEMDILYTKKQ